MKNKQPKPTEMDQDWAINQMIRDHLMQQMEKSGKMETMKKKIKKVMASMDTKD